MTLAQDRRFLLVVNAGSDDVSTFAVHGASLELRSRVSSGGAAPGSVAVRGHLVYVLDGGAPNGVTGAGRLLGGRRAAGRHREGHERHRHAAPGLGRRAVRPRRASLRGRDAVRLRVHPRGDARRLRRGRRRAYTTNAHSGSISVYAVAEDGALSLRSTISAGEGSTPLDVAFDDRSRELFVLDGGRGAIAAFDRLSDGSLAPAAVTTGIPASAAGIAAY